jgi:hypothetical protein
LDAFPPLDNVNVASEHTRIVIGDLHGNALKMLYVLLRHQFVEMSERNYLDFVRIYRTNKLNQSHIDQFGEIMKTITVIDTAKQSRISLIGDELCDRGMNDYFVLKVIQFLHQCGFEYEILVSNHSIEFISCYEKGTDFSENIFFGGQGRSSENFQALIDNQFILRQDMNEIIENSYKPFLKAISYITNEQKSELSILSHAPIGVDNIDYIACSLNLALQEKENISSICETIDEINQKLSTCLASNIVYDLFKIPDCIFEITTGNPISPSMFPLAHLIWNRDHSVVRPTHITFVHGHDNCGYSKYDNVINLDNNLGKGLSMHKGEYTVLYCKLK